MEEDVGPLVLPVLPARTPWELTETEQVSCESSVSFTVTPQSLVSTTVLVSGGNWQQGHTRSSATQSPNAYLGVNLFFNVEKFSQEKPRAIQFGAVYRSLLNWAAGDTVHHPLSREHRTEGATDLRLLSRPHSVGRR